jgi:Bacterial Ig-like domain (group 3)/FG-GAP-like repeat
MMRLPHRSPCFSVSAFKSFCYTRGLYFLMMLLILSPAAFGTTPTPASTVTTLAISSTSVAYQTPIILTATVTAGNSPITAGLVLFCEATAKYCENNSALGIAQLTFPTATASVKIGSGPIGNHSYKAVFRANNLYASSESNTVTYSVTGTYGSSLTLTSAGSVGNYSLTGTVAGVGSLNTGPSGTISFLDTSTSNSLLGTENLVVSTLSTTFVQNQPFAIGGSGATLRSVAIASAYLNADNNLDVVTGDAAQTISVLLGNGDGTFQPQVNYAGCTVGKALQIVLADFNRDGVTDIALGCSDGTNGGLVILLGSGDGTFKTPVYHPTGDVAGIAIGDFNNDGLLDIVVSNKSQQKVVFFLGDGTGKFLQETVHISTPALAHGVVVADFNMDGNDDVAYALDTATPNSSLSDLYLALGNGDGTFQIPTSPVATEIGEFLTAGDTNADDFPDVVASSITRPNSGNSNIGNSLFVLLGNGKGAFQTSTYVSDIPSDPHLADVNGDGIPDIIAGGSTGALVYQGNGDGTFQNYQEPGIGGFALTYAVNAGDYNNDGNADLIGTDADTPRAAVSLSQVQQTSVASALTHVAVFPLGSGVHNVDASYSGDSVYVGSLSPTVQLTAAPVDTALVLTASALSSIFPGQSVVLTAMLSPYTVGPPTTTTNNELVKFFTGTTLLGSAKLVNGVATLTTTALPIGADALTAVFAGDSNYNPSTSNTVTATVSGVTLSSSPNPSTYLQAVTFTGTVPTGKAGTIVFFDGSTSIGSGVISGTTATFTTSSLSVGSHNITAQYSSNTSAVLVQVVNKTTPSVSVTTSGPSVYGSSVTITATVPSGTTGTITITSGGVSLGSGTVSPTTGTVTITTTTLPVGNDPITASYGGDTNNNPATGSTTQTVAKASPAETLSSSINPSAANQLVVFTASVPSNATGTVTFTSGSTVLGTSTLANGVATVSTSTLPIGSDAITATYNGDANNNTATATLTQSVNKTTPTVIVTTSGQSTYGSPVTITATVPPGTTGTITITSGGTTLGSGTVNPTTGIVTITTTTLPVGSDPITASYGGDTNDNPATGTTTQTVTKANPVVTLTSSANPSAANQSVTFTASLPSGVTGTVTFTSGATVLGTSTLASGAATISTSTLPTGNDAITATYNGDANNNSATVNLTQIVGKPDLTVSVTTSGPSIYGNPVTITATVPPGTTGTITFTSGGVTLGSGSVNPTTGTVTISTTILPVGSDPITASYGGDSNNNPATGTTIQTVSKASPKETLSSSLNPSVANQPVVFTASLPSNTTGTVTFSSGSTVLGTSTLANGVATVSTSTLPIGSDAITATYNGDANDNSATATMTQTVDKATPTVIVTTSGSSSYGNPVTITTTVPPGTTGTITVTSGGTTLGSGPINPTTGTVTITTTTLPVGSDPITASYGGDTNDNPATGTTTQTVTKATPTVGLTSSINPSAPNQSVTFAATLPSGVTGTVTFTNGSTVLGTSTLTSGAATVTTSTLPTGSDTIIATYNGDSNYNSAAATLIQSVGKTTPIVIVTTSGPSTSGSPVTITTTVPPGTTGTITVTSGGTTLGSGTVNPTTGTVTITTTTLPVGSDPITASYGGDTNDNPATGTTTQIVTKANPAVTLTSSANPSAANQSVTFTATLPSGVTGTVTFTSGATVLGTSTLTSSAATISTSTLPTGNDAITATYNGDANNNSATANLTQIVGKLTPVLPPPVVSSANLPIDTPETITETVPTGVTGTVTFSNGSTPLGTATIVNGVATLTVPLLPLGVDSITAATSGDANYNPATSPPTLVTVGKSVTTVTLTSSANPAAFDQLVTFSATVHAGATGLVTFLDGSIILGTGALNAAGVATFSTSALMIGSHPITASFGGDSHYSSSTSSVLTQMINKIPTIITITESTPAQLIKTGITFTANVTASSPNATGTVTFLDGTTVLGTASLTSNGGVAVSLTTNANAAMLTSSLAMGTHQIVAVYSGDSSFAPSTSAPANDIVEDFTNTNSGPASQNVFPGATTSYNFSLAPISATTFLNDVTVTVTGLPPGSTYTFSPSTVAAGSGTTGVVLNVQTSSSLKARNSPPQGNSSKNELSIALGMFSLLGLGTMRTFRKKIPRTLMLALLALGSLLPIAALSGCAGGYFTLTPTTYTVTVTGTEGTVQHSATATLIVQ